jgi:hypothetical protein
MLHTPPLAKGGRQCIYATYPPFSKGGKGGFEKTRDYLSAKGLLLREGTIVDATIINKTPYRRWIKGLKKPKSS